jgi:NAD(P)H dehydrogenase (quinone)
MAPMTQLLVVIGHADRGSFTHAIAHAYAEAAAEAGAQVARLELDALRFDLVLRPNQHPPQPLEHDLQRAQAAISAADHVAWFFPTWWAAPPALVKGFIDRTFLPGYAYTYESGRALQHKLLRGRSARLVTSMDAPWWWYALFYWRALHASFIGATLRFVGFAPVRRTTLYGLRSASVEQRKRMLARVARQGARDARATPRRPTLPA